MNILRISLLTFGLAVAAQVQGQVISPVGVTGSGSFYSSLSSTPSEAAHVLIDGVFPPESTNWQDPAFFGGVYHNGYDTSFFPVGTTNATATGGTTVWWTANTLTTGAANPVNFTIDFGSLYNLTGLKWSVDNNDGYYAQYSTDGVVFTPLFSMTSSAGNVGWGMDTITGVVGDPDYDAQMAFSPVWARYIRVGATAGAGDGMYAIGEVQAFGTAVVIGNPVPEPSTYGMVGALGLVAAALYRRRRTQR